MLCSRFLQPASRHAETGTGSARVARARLRRHARAYRAALRCRPAPFALHHAGGDACYHRRTIGYAFYTIPKGFFPIEDTGFIVGATEAAAGHLLRRHGREAASRSTASFATDPAVRSPTTWRSASAAPASGSTAATLSSSSSRAIERPPIGEVIQQLRRAVAAVHRHQRLLAAGAEPQYRRRARARASTSTPCRPAIWTSCSASRRGRRRDPQSCPACRTSSSTCRSATRRRSSTSIGRKPATLGLTLEQIRTTLTTPSARDRSRRSTPPATTIR